jgi:phosphohistidine phosphatase
VVDLADSLNHHNPEEALVMTTPTAERTLMLLRHAKAEQVQGKSDHDRELAARGRGDARAVGEWLGDPSRAVVPDLVLCSTSERTRQTLDGLGGGVSFKEIRFDERIYNASADLLFEVLREVSDSVDAVMVIGHAPGIPVLARTLAQDGAGSAAAIDRLSNGFPTSGLAILGFGGRWAALEPETAFLRDFVVPRG